MNNNCKFSDVTNKYLHRFDEILEQMIKGMTSVELSNSISRNFILQMIPHHEAAIKMSKNILCYTTLIPLQEIAQNIVAEQTKSIENMRAALNCCTCRTNSRADLCQYRECFEQITRTMFHGMRTARATNDINANFMREMIPHHEGAIRMSENALRFSICPELVPILKAIIVSQKRGVKEMEQLLCIVTK